jgi:SPP1 gp7 family putative phage head morphogenesis protein
MATADASAANARARTILAHIDLGDWSPAGSHISEGISRVYADSYRRALRAVGYRTGAETINQARANLGRKLVAHGDVSPFGRPRRITRASQLRKDLLTDEEQRRQRLQDQEDEADIGVSVDLVNERAVAWAKKRAADLVTDISDNTRDMLQSAVVDAIEQGMGSRELAERISESLGFSEARAETISRTELIRASNAAALDAYKASGVVDGKSWLTAGDDLVEEDCEMNEADGVIPLDDDFSSGDSAPPSHPNCRCALQAEFLDEGEE